MAGPFSVDPNSAREIASAQQSGGSTLVPRSSLLGDAANLLGQVAPVIEQVEKTKAQEELRGNITSITSALKAARFPNVQTELFTEEGMVNPANKAAIRELQKLANASIQGKLPLSFAIERMNVVINEAVTAAPEWAPELNQVARDMLGFSPQHRMMAELLSAPERQGLTAEQKGQEQAKQEASKLGISVEEWQGLQLQTAKGALEKQQMTNRKLANEYDANVAARDVQLSSGELAMQFMGHMREQLASGGVQDPQQIKALITGAYSQERQRLIANMPTGTDVGVMNANLKVLDDQMASLMSLADNTSALTYLTNNNKVIQEIAKNDVYALEHVGPIFAVAGSEGGIALMNAINRYKDNPAAQRLFKKSGQGGAGLWNLADQLASTRKALGRYQEKAPATSDQERVEDVTTGAALLEQKGLKGTDAVPLIEWVRQSGGDTVSILNLKQNKLVSNLSAVKEAHPAIINLYQSELARLQMEYDQLAQAGAVPSGGVVVQGNAIQAGSQLSARDDTGLSSKYNAWVKKMNNLTDYAVKYQSTGVMPPSVFGGVQQVATDLNTRKVEMQNEAVKTRKAVRGPDGKLKFEE